MKERCNCARATPTTEVEAPECSRGSGQIKQPPSGGLGVRLTSRRQSRQHMPPEQSEGGIGGYLSGRRLAVLILRPCWRVYDGAAGKELRQIVGQAGAVGVGRGEVGRKTRDDVGGEFGSVVGWDERMARHGAEC